MNTLTSRAIIAAAILAAATSLAQSVAYGQQKQDSDGKYAEVIGMETR